MPLSIITVARDPTAATIAGRMSMDRRRAVEMAATMVGDDHAVDSERHQTLGVRRMQYAFHDEGALPAIAQPSKLIPGMAAAAAHLHDHLGGRIPGRRPRVYGTTFSERSIPVR